MNTLTVATTYTQAVPSAVTTGVAAYLFIAFGLAWAVWIPLWLLGISPESPLSSAAMIVAVLAPAIAAIIVRRWVTREGFADAGLPPQLRTRWPYYLFAWLWPLLAFAVLLVATRFGLMIRKDVSGDIVPALIASLAMTPVLWGEEFGWRSYLQRRLFGDRPLLAAVVTGAIWGVWHYPMVLAGYLPNQHGLAGLLLFPAYTILFSILLGWLRWRSRNIWVPSLAHAANNMVLETLGGALFAATPGNGDLFLDVRGLIVLIPLGGLCAWIVLSGQLSNEMQSESQRATNRVHCSSL